MDSQAPLNDFQKDPDYSFEDPTFENPEILRQVEAAIENFMNEYAAFLTSPLGSYLNKISPTVGQDYLESKTKRSLDLAAAAIAVLPAEIVALAAATIVRVSEGQPGIFRQTRMGKDGEEFVIKKVRTMRPGAESEITPEQIWKDYLRNGAYFDKRITSWFTEVLRKGHLDELFQFANVLSGELSIVGIRVTPQNYIDALGPIWGGNLHCLWKESYFCSRPGLTAITQVASPHPNYDPARYIGDIIYTQNASLALDIFIIKMTFDYLLRKSRSKLSRILSKKVKAVSTAPVEEVASTTGAETAEIIS